MLRSTDSQPLISSRTSRPDIASVGTEIYLNTYQATSRTAGHDLGTPADIRFVFIQAALKPTINDLIPLTPRRARARLTIWNRRTGAKQELLSWPTKRQVLCIGIHP
jgi:hypothetical protein